MVEQEYTMLFRIDTQEGIKSIGDLRENIKILKKAIDKATDSTERNALVKDLQVNQKALKIAMEGTAQSMYEVEKTANGLGDSYNALSAKMAMLKREMKQTSDEAKRNELSAHINEINDRLKDMDANNGVFSRNVGNYTQSITSAFGAITQKVDVLDKGFGSMGISIGGLKAPLMGLNGMFTMLSANPFIAVIGALVVVIQQVAKWMKTSEDNVNALNLALAPLTASTTAFKNIMQKLGEWLGKAVQWLTDLAKKLHLFSDEMLKSIEVEETLTKKEQEQVKKQRAFAKEIAETERDIADLKNKASQKDKYTAKERLKFLNDAIDKEEAIAKKRKTMAEEELAIQRGRAAQAGNSAEENEKLAQAEVAVYQAETDYLNKTKKLNAQRVEAINQIKSETKAVKELKQEYKADAVEEEEIVEEVDVEAENEALKQHYITNAEWEGINARYDAQKAEEEAFAEHNAWMEEETKRSEEEKAQIRKDGLLNVSHMTADILGSIADIVGNENEKQFRVSKGLQIAQATINTIAGAVGAFTGITASTGGWGIALAVAQASAVLSAGMAQVAKIKATKFDKGGKGGAPSLSGMSANASTNAPKISTDVPVARQLTSASEEERLNRMAKDQKVYILSSDLEADADARKAVVAETSL